MSRSNVKNFSWLFKLLSIFFSVSPTIASVSIFFSLLAQITLLLSFLLPMKIIILLASEGPTRLAPAGFFDFGRNGLVLMLSGLSVVFFFTNMISNRVHEIFTQKGVSLLERKNKKLYLFEGQDEFTRRSYIKLTSLSSSFVFLLLVSSFYVVYYLPILVVCVGILSLTAGIVWHVKARSEDGELSDKKLGKVLILMQGGGFFAVFGCIIINFIYFNPPEFIIALISVIASRQFFSNGATVIRLYHGLLRSSRKLNAIFFHDVAYSGHLKYSSRIWQLLDEKSMKLWLPEIVNLDSEKDWSELKINWMQSGIEDVLFLVIENKSFQNKHLLKIYHKKHSQKASHEAFLLMSEIKGLPAPPLEKCKLIYGHHMHLMSFPQDCTIGSASISNYEFNINLIGVPIPDDIAEKYKRSHIMASQRIGDEDFRNLEVVSSTGERELVEEFKLCFSGMCGVMEKLPLILSSPYRREWAATCKNENVVLIDWSSWKLEQGIAAWPATEEALSELADKLKAFRDSRPSLMKVSAASLQFSVLFHNLCRMMKAQRYTDVLNNISLLLKYYYLSKERGVQHVQHLS